MKTKKPKKSKATKRCHYCKGSGIALDKYTCKYCGGTGVIDRRRFFRP